MKNCLFLPVYMALVAALFTAGSAGKLAAADWPNFRGPNHNGISSEKLPLSRPFIGRITLLWEETIGSGCSSVAISDGRLYTMGNTGKKNDESTHEDVVYCFDADTGEEIWTHTYKCGLNFKSNTPTGPFGTPAVDGNSVYTFSRKGDVFCLNARTSKVRWHRDLKEELGMKPPFQGGFAGSPLVLGDIVILNAGHAGTALNKHTGKVVWKSDSAEAAQATPVPFRTGNTECVAIFSGFGIIGVNATDGHEMWSLPWDTKYRTNVADPIIANDKVFISTWYGMGCALLDISKGEPNVIWQHKDMQNHYSSCVLWEGCLYGFDISKLRCMDFGTGRMKWALAGGFGRGSLMLAGGKLIVLTEKGVLMIGDASPKGFTPIVQTKIIKGKCYAGPVLSGGKIYARNDKSKLVCVTIVTD